MRSDTFAKERVSGALACAIEKLRGQEDIAWRVFFLQAADRCHADDPADVKRAERVDVGAVIQFMWQDPMAAAVPRQEINLPPDALCPPISASDGAPNGVSTRMFGRVLARPPSGKAAPADDPDCLGILMSVINPKGAGLKCERPAQMRKRIISPWRRTALALCH